MSAIVNLIDEIEDYVIRFVIIVFDDMLISTKKTTSVSR